MIGKLVLLVVVAALAGLAYCALIAQTYPFVLASPEARASLEVSEAQRAELNAAQHKSDVIAFSIFGAVLCSVVAVVGIHPVNFQHRATSAVIGLLIGAICGAGTGLIGYAFYRVMDPIINDPMVHVFSRLAVMFIPIALAVGITVAIGAKRKSEMLNATIGAMVGAVLTALLYGVMAGLVTPLEIVAAIFPSHSQNRHLLFVTAFSMIGALTFVQVSRGSKAAGEPSGEALDSKES